ncbi:hypothetical protein KLP40_02275 [Hymenobacter sp. NST-14]|uniref:hypothetical protein n=1 Tax=Hymenobacter piscis TaxID=2839984 RepID=UPI001C01420B|nr:hypothetical protein [Hymenobacter piscis]MBT9391978.1 hypothetical protein [Hymenobacter piscis]
MKGRFLRWALGAICLLTGRAQAQEAASRVLTVSPVVGEVIDAQEKATYGLFPTFSAADFQEARFYQSLSPDSAVTLHVLLRDGRTALRPYSPAELSAVRESIEARRRELAATPATPASPVAPADSIGRRYRVILRTGTAFDGELTARRPRQLEFLTQDLGVVQVERANIQRLEELNSEVAKRPANWYDIGNGSRLFFAPTARGLREGEGALQDISLYFVGANYGLTDNFSMGAVVSLIPGLPLHDQFVALTPKFSARISDKWHAGAGVLYLRVPSFDSSEGSYGVGLLYGVGTYGSADNNFTAGIGYGFAGGDIGSTPVLQLGGQKRISRRVSLITENYIIANREAGMGGLYGAKINWKRTSLGLAALYVIPYDGDYAFSTYVIPAFIDFTFRFGKPAR